MINWVAQGRYPVGLTIGGNADQARREGLPVDQVRRPMKEGERITAGYGAVARLSRAPHPSAATVYINWLLSRSGQTAFQEIVEDNSLRTDVPKDKLLGEGTVPQPGVPYFFAEQAKYILDDQAEAEIRRIVTDALAGR
jgi:ABC-type Fe3+ transport system substrate-binding protein